MSGYDQPLLHTMFVDKTLVGLAAVQTLSRLNRIHPDKTDTFVLDFRNEAEAITEAFEPWYETTVAVPTDPNLLHDLANRLLALQVLDQGESFAVAAILADPSTPKGAHGQVYALLGPAVARFEALGEDAQTEARSLLDQFTRVYSFLSQVVDFADVSLEALYLASRALILLLPSSEDGGRLDLGAEVELTHLRLEQTSQGSISPEHGIGELSSIYSGQGKQAEDEKEHLSRIINVVNERFGLQLGTADQLFFDQLEEAWVADETLVAQARANDLANFRLPFTDVFLKTIVGRMDDNADIFKRLLDEPSFQATVLEHYLQRVFERARAAEGP